MPIHIKLYFYAGSKRVVQITGLVNMTSRYFWLDDAILPFDRS